MSDFDFGYTCPDIDKLIKRAEGEIESYIDGLLEEVCPLLTNQLRASIAGNHAARLYECLEDIFEKTRATNERMRAAAEHQIKRLNERIESLQDEVNQHG